MRELEIKRIYLPKPNVNNEYVTYENQLGPRVKFGNESLKDLFVKYEEEIMKNVEKEIKDYVNCDDLCNDEEDMFPKRSVLTGEWYLRDVYFEEGYYLSICTAFLGTSLGYKDDYLGLEVIFYFDEESKSFILDGVNSESI